MSWYSPYAPYVSAAEKRRRAEKAAAKLEKSGGTRLQPIRVEGRLIAISFWGKAWCKNLESYSDYSNRLPRGRSYVRNGSVVDLQISAGQVTALVSGSKLYRVSIGITSVRAGAWKALKTECSGQVGSLIDLLQGKLSGPVMEIMTRRATGLFPEPTEIRLACSCPDHAGMCKHVAAVLYGVGARLDHTPELLFILRGADHLELISDAAKSVSKGAATPGADTIATDALADVFGIEIDSAEGATLAPETAPGRAKPSRRKTAAVAKVTAKRQAKNAKGSSARTRPPEPSARTKPKSVKKRKLAKRPKAKRATS